MAGDAVQQPLPVETPLAPAVDTRDGITVESNTGTAEELKASLDALDAAIADPAREAKTGRFTSKERRTNPVARMEEATAREAAAKRERDEAKAETAKLQAQLERVKTIPPPQAPDPRQFHESLRGGTSAEGPADDPEPDGKDLATYPAGIYDPKYLREIGRWEARQEFKKQRGIEQRTQAQEQRLQVLESAMSVYAKRVGESFPDQGALDTFLQSMPPELLALKPSEVQRFVAPKDPITGANAIADVISDTEKPVAVMTYLKENPRVFQRLLTLHPVQVVREMGRIEASLAAAPASAARTAPAKEPSRARPPVQRVESVPQLSDGPPGDDASDQEHVEYYNRKEIARRFGRG